MSKIKCQCGSLESTSILTLERSEIVHGFSTLLTLAFANQKDGRRRLRLSKGVFLDRRAGVITLIVEHGGGSKHFYEVHENPRLTLSESQFKGRFFEREIHYGNGVGIAQFGDGSLYVTAHGNPRMRIDRCGRVEICAGGGVRNFDDKANQLFTRLPRRPRFAELSDRHVVKFSNDIELQFLLNGSVILLSRGQSYKVQTTWNEADSFTPNQWRDLLYDCRMLEPKTIDVGPCY